MCVFFFNDTATTEIYPLSLHDALPISDQGGVPAAGARRLRLRLRVALVALGLGLEGDVADRPKAREQGDGEHGGGDRKSTRLNSSHANISYAVFCLKKKKSLYPTALI